MSAEPERLPAALGRALDRLADEDIEQVVAAARARARERVQETLEQALVQRLLTRVTRGEKDFDTVRADPDPSAGASTESASAGGSEPDAFYLYGVVSGTAALDLTFEAPGVAPGEPPEIVTSAGLGAVVSRVPWSVFGDEHLKTNLEDLAWLERTARAHEAVVEATRAQTTMIPMRLCTLFRTRAAIAEMLAREAETLDDALRRLAGKTEWSVKVMADRAAVGKSLMLAVVDEPSADEVSPGHQYLRGRQAERRTAGEVDEWLRHTIGDIHESLTGKAGSALCNPVQRPELTGYEGEMLLNGVYLVDDLLTDDFRTCVDSLSRRYSSAGIRLELTGPWPPYNFVAAAEPA